MGDRLADVVGVEPAGDQQAPVVDHAFGQPPVEDLPGPRVGAVN